MMKLKKQKLKLQEEFALLFPSEFRDCIPWLVQTGPAETLPSPADTDALLDVQDVHLQELYVGQSPEHQ